MIGGVWGTYSCSMGVDKSVAVLEDNMRLCDLLCRKGAKGWTAEGGLTGVANGDDTRCSPAAAAAANSGDSRERLFTSIVKPV